MTTIEAKPNCQSTKWNWCHSNQIRRSHSHSIKYLLEGLIDGSKRRYSFEDVWKMVIECSGWSSFVPNTKLKDEVVFDKT